MINEAHKAMLMKRKDEQHVATGGEVKLVKPIHTGMNYISSVPIDD